MVAKMKDLENLSLWQRLFWGSEFKNSNNIKKYAADKDN